MIHVQEIMNFCKRKEFYKSYEKAKTNFEDCTTRLASAQNKLDDANADPTTSADRNKALKKSLELATTAVELAERTIPRKGKNFCFLHKTLLGDNA